MKTENPYHATLRYGSVAQGLHWGIAALVAGLLGLGFTMTALPLTHPWAFPLFQLHKSVGITVLVLMLLRLLWRLTHKPPAFPGTLSPWERLGASGAHCALYGLLFFLPLSGWVLVSASPYNIPTILYGLVPWPHLPFVTDSPVKEHYETWGENLHEIAVWILIGVLALHAGAALRHHYILKDSILIRMLPQRWTSHPKGPPS